MHQSEFQSKFMVILLFSPHPLFSWLLPTIRGPYAYYTVASIPKGLSKHNWRLLSSFYPQSMPASSGLRGTCDACLHFVNRDWNRYEYTWKAYAKLIRLLSTMTTMLSALLEGRCRRSYPEKDRLRTSISRRLRPPCTVAFPRHSGVARSLRN